MLKLINLYRAVSSDQTNNLSNRNIFVKPCCNQVNHCARHLLHMYEGGDRVLEAIQWANSSSRFIVHVKNVKYINNSYLLLFHGKMKLFNDCACVKYVLYHAIILRSSKWPQFQIKPYIIPHFQIKPFILNLATWPFFQP